MKNEKNNFSYFSEEEMTKGQEYEKAIEVMEDPVPLPYLVEHTEELIPVENPQNIRLEVSFMGATDVDIIEETKSELTIVKAKDGELPF